MLAYIKAVAAAVGSLIGTWTYVAFDDSLSFEEIGVLGSAVIAVLAALVTFVSPRNQPEA
jgi:hypothetical protein